MERACVSMLIFDKAAALTVRRGAFRYCNEKRLNASLFFQLGLNLEILTLFGNVCILERTHSIISTWPQEAVRTTGKGGSTMTANIEAAAPCVAERPIVRPRAISRGTMISTDLDAARIFYEEFLGFECVRVAPTRLLVRMRSYPAGKERQTGDYCLIEVQQAQSIAHPQNVLNHWGIDVPTQADVDRIHAAAHKHKERYGLRRIMKVRMQHGVYAFYFEDRDFNWWEIEQRDPGRTHAPLFLAGDKYPD